MIIKIIEYQAKFALWKNLHLNLYLHLARLRILSFTRDQKLLNTPNLTTLKRTLKKQA